MKKGLDKRFFHTTMTFMMLMTVVCEGYSSCLY
jgi:hypothetical protein